MKYLKITAGLLLLVQVFHLASLQTPSTSAKTIDKSWLRKILDGSQNAAVTDKETETDQGSESGTAPLPSSGEEGMVGQDKSANETSDDLNVVTTALPPVFQNGTTRQPQMPDAKVSATTTIPSQITTKGAEEELNSTATPQNSSNHVDLQSTTLAPKNHTTQESTTDKKTELTHSAPPPVTTRSTTTAAPPKNKTSTASSPTTVTRKSTEKSTVTTASAAPNTPEKVNKTGEGGSSGSGSERGSSSDERNSSRQGAWGAVLGTAVAVFCVGLVAYIILKKKHQKGFSHRKLVEDYPSDPVLRLDNSEPLDLNMGGSAYYNPGLQGDNIQMTTLPGRR